MKGQMVSARPKRRLISNEGEFATEIVVEVHRNPRLIKVKTPACHVTALTCDHALRATIGHIDLCFNQVRDILEVQHRMLRHAGVR